MSYHQRPTIGNQGAHTRSYQQAPPPYSMGGGGDLFGNPYAAQQQFPGGLGLSSVTPEASSLPVPVSTSASGGKGGGLASLFSGGGSGSGTGGSSFNMAQVKQMIDRLGGIEGIMDTMGKVQKMVQSVQQMAPLVKLLMGSFAKGKKGGDIDELPSDRKKRRKRKPTATGKRRTKRRTGR
ncbi:hypothetical protein [Paenibacillus rigui]|uniref:Tyrosine protein kinase n=1 Tax=Paenibacillus rigui TaxID=554312 RepID=A0A229UW76_9BACL|nr:hypothetical protein [Paenibacillus rigui]OXM87541.1 hypothetical protein CF651_04225 [Paenibacillus rigui]